MRFDVESKNIISIKINRLKTQIRKCYFAIIKIDRLNISNLNIEIINRLTVI